ncbi:MAG: von Willebrand factor, type [Candidatus Sulfotelmatobacter sp.]|nr:von Willebrand factor, type [Candidatus Sulfotelmatobacter sp.]
MQGPDITPRRNKRHHKFYFPVFAIRATALVALFLQPFAAQAGWKAAQLQPGAGQFARAQSQQPSSQPPQSQPAQPPSVPQEDPQSKPGAGSPPSNSPNQQQVPEENGTYVIRKDVDEVLLHATVVDDKQRIVTDLDKNAFTIFEDGKPQAIVSFRHEDIPVAMGIVIDNSGSMREKRAKVNQAALNLVRSSNPQDEVFVVNFNDEYYLDQDFTNDLLKLKEALEKIDAKGGTALYEALVASAGHLKRNARLERKVLFVVTDGEDNASQETLEQAVKQLQEENGPSVYAIGILGDEEHPKRAKRALEIITQRTGGLAFFPKTLDEVDEISHQVAHDIRNQYTIGYRPTNPRSSGGFRQIKVEAKVKGHSKLVVRTKSGYYAGTQRAATSR